MLIHLLISPVHDNYYNASLRYKASSYKNLMVYSVNEYVFKACK